MEVIPLFLSKGDAVYDIVVNHDAEIDPLTVHKGAFLQIPCGD
jgi:hypothetical protein